MGKEMVLTSEELAEQEIITVFFDKEDVLGCFVRTVCSMRDSLNQEDYAYELNGTMFVYDAEEFCTLVY